MHMDVGATGCQKKRGDDEHTCRWIRMSMHMDDDGHGRCSFFLTALCLHSGSFSIPSCGLRQPQAQAAKMCRRPLRRPSRHHVAGTAGMVLHHAGKVVIVFALHHAGKVVIGFALAALPLRGQVAADERVVRRQQSSYPRAPGPWTAQTASMSSASRMPMKMGRLKTGQCRWDD